MNVDMSDFFAKCPGLTAEEQAIVQDRTNKIAALQLQVTENAGALRLRKGIKLVK